MDICQWMVEEGQCDFRATNTFGCNAIQWCTQTGDVPMCRYLQSIGLDITLTNRNGHSAVHKAAVKGQVTTVLFDHAYGHLSVHRLKCVNGSYRKEVWGPLSCRQTKTATHLPSSPLGRDMTT